MNDIGKTTLQNSRMSPKYNGYRTSSDIGKAGEGNKASKHNFLPSRLPRHHRPSLT